MSTSKPQGQRPLSPHLGIWRWPATMASSIFHRMTGVGNAIGTVMLTWWLVALAAGPETYGVFADFAGSALGRLLLFGFTVSVCYHLLNGVRHLVWDAGHAFNVQGSQLWSWINILGGLLLAILIWFAAYSNMGVL